MSWPALLFRWVGWTLILALVMGGKPWVFPLGGRPLLAMYRERLTREKEAWRGAAPPGAWRGP